MDCRATRSATTVVASAMLSVAVAATFSAGQRYGQARAERNASDAQALERWQTAFTLEREQLDADRATAAAARIELAERLATLQARLIRLDALGERLAARAEFAGVDFAEFDFETEPSIGGPEETADSRMGRAADLTAATEALAAALDDRWLKFTVLEDLVRLRKLDADVRPGGRPVATGYVSSRFGRRIDPFTGKMAAHRGVDFAGPAGTEIVAVASGIVVWAGPRPGYGELVEIDHGHGHVTRYAHNAENLVAVGDVVTRGEPIARLGATGRATGPNLHFEVLRDGSAVNPLLYIE